MMIFYKSQIKIQAPFTLNIYNLKKYLYDNFDIILEGLTSNQKNKLIYIINKHRYNLSRGINTTKEKLKDEINRFLTICLKKRLDKKLPQKQISLKVNKL